MRLSLSKKEVAEIHLILTTLPIPPIPVALKMNYEQLEDAELKAAFEMATCSLVKDSLSDDGIVNSHSIFAALSFFVKWSASTGTDPLKKHQDMQHKKDASLLRIIARVLDYSETLASTKHTTNDDDILQLFITSSQEWINTYLPDTIMITISPAPKNKTIGFEHDLHIAMAHYCYSQGVLYNSKNSTLVCKVHDRLYHDFLEQQKSAAEDVVLDKVVTGDDTDNAATTFEHMEIAAMYSQFPYHKMMLLCFDRLLQDCLYGYTAHNSDENVQQNARDLLKMSFANYESMTNKTASLVSPKSACILQDPTPSNISNKVCETNVNIFPSTGTNLISFTAPDSSKALSEIVDQTNDLTITDSSDRVQLLDPIQVEDPDDIQKTQINVPSVSQNGKHTCAADMGSYKSSIGIFILGIVNFLQKDDPYFTQNMCTSLRHLSELMLHGNDKAKEACLLINIPELVKLVRFNIHGLAQGGTIDEIQTILLEIEATFANSPNTDPVTPMDALDTSLQSDSNDNTTKL